MFRHLNYFVYGKVSSRDAFFQVISWSREIKHFTVLAPAANTTNIDYEQPLLFFTARSLRQAMIIFVWIHKNLWSYLVKDNGHKEQNSRQPETRIMKGELLTSAKKFNEKFLPKLQLSPYKTFRSSFKTVYVFVEKAVLWMSALQMSGKNRDRLESPLGSSKNPVCKTS